jgi:hypothetical protein
MERPETTPRGFENPYQSFLWKELSIIRELERNEKYYQALHLSVSLLKYLQPEVRKKQEKQAKTIFTKIRQTVANTRGPDFYTTRILRNRVAKQLGQQYLEEVITALSNQLGARAYMERRGISPRTKGGGRLTSE